MKKTFLIIAGILACLCASAQESERNENNKKEIFHWGITAGAGVSTVNPDNKGGIVDPSLSLQLGATFDFKMRPNTFMETGLYYQKVAYSRTFKPQSEPNKKIEQTFDASYIKLPVSFNYKIGIKDVSVIPQLGAYVAFAPASATEEPVDFGLRFGVGVQYKEIFRVSAKYDCGLMALRSGTNQSVVGDFTFFFK